MKKLQKSRMAALLSGFLKMAAFLSLATVIGYAFRHIGFPETNIVLLYLLGVLLTARYTKGYLYGAAASFLSIFAYNYFFTHPYYTFSVSDPSYIVTFSVMMLASLITSTLTAHVMQNTAEARERESEIKALYLLTNRLTDAEDIHRIAETATEIIGKVMNCDAACLCFQKSNRPEPDYIQHCAHAPAVRRETEHAAQIKQQADEAQGSCYFDAEFCNWFIYGSRQTLGLIRIPAEKAALLTETQTHLLRAMVENTALAMDRIIAAQQKAEYQERSKQEHYRSNILRAISHDLRTPLSGIMGTSEMLMDMSKQNDPRYELAKQIYSDADWLRALVENILSLTKLQDGKLSLNKRPEAAEEVIGGAIRHIMQRAPGREIAVSLPEELLLIPMDAKLIEQVLINLLDNAIRHTAPEGEVRVSVEAAEGCARFAVSDRGCGIPPEDLAHVFNLFYTTHGQHADARQGIGLGLAICDAIVKAHGGAITAANRAGGGAEFIFTLPLEAE